VRLQRKVLPGITKDISWGTKSGSSLLIAVGERSNGPKILVHASNAVKAVTGQGSALVRLLNRVVVPCMIRLHTIAVIPPVITITRLETNIRDTLARGMIAMATPLRPHPLQPEIIDGL
jgi:hypothetical protein